MSEFYSFDKGGARVESPWQVLGLEPGSSEAQIRARYRELVLQYPPESESRRFIEINEACQRLTDPAKAFERRFRDFQILSPADLGFGPPAQETARDAKVAPAPVSATPMSNENPDWLVGELFFYALLGLFTNEDELADLGP